MIELLELAHRLRLYEHKKSLPELLDKINQGKNENKVCAILNGPNYFISENSIPWLKKEILGDTDNSNLVEVKRRIIKNKKKYKPIRTQWKRERSVTLQKSWAKRQGKRKLDFKDYFSKGFYGQFWNLIKNDRYITHKIINNNFDQEIMNLIKGCIDKEDLNSDHIINAGVEAAKIAVNRFSISSKQDFLDSEGIINNYIECATSIAKRAGKDITISNRDIEDYLQNGKFNENSILDKEKAYFKIQIEKSVHKEDNLEQMIREETEKLIKQDRFKDNQHALYFISEELTKKIGKNIYPNKLYHLLSDRLKSRFKYPGFDKGHFFLLRNLIINSLNEGNFDEYCNLYGIYNLATRIEKQNRVSLNLNSIYQIIGKKDGLVDIINDPELSKGIDSLIWKNKVYHLSSLSQLETILDFLRQQYKNDPDEFFKKYGSRTGLYILGKELKKEKNIDIRLAAVSSVTGDRKILPKLLGIDDERFFTEWRPKTSFLRVDEVDKITEHLRNRYNENSQKFFDVYGSRNGGIMLAREMELKYNFKLNPTRISQLVENGRDLSTMLGIEDRRFEEWNPQNIQLTHDSIEFILKFLKKKYIENHDKFFDKYGSELGQLNLAIDLKKDANLEMRIEKIGPLVSNGKELAKLLNLNDVRFNTEWKNRKLNFNVSEVECIIDFLKKEYKKDRKEFLKEYGSSLGIINVATKLKHKLSANTLNRVSTLIGNGRNLCTLLEVNDRELERQWKPRYICLDLNSIEDVVQIVKEEYARDSNKFLSRYGSKAGVIHLSQDLNSKGLDISPFRLYTMMGNGKVLADLLDVKEDKFQSLWKPRLIMLNLNEVKSILNFLEQQYKNDAEKFFERYGSRIGQLNLARDLLKVKGRTYNLNSLNTLVYDKEMLFELLGIKDNGTKEKWNPKTIPLPLDKINMIIHFIKEKYKNNSDKFFETYGSKDGVIKIAKDLRKNGLKIQDLMPLSTLVCNGKDLSDFLEVNDERFNSSWKPVQQRIDADQAEITLNFLAEEYTENQDNFFYKYGSREGGINLLKDLKREKGLELKLNEINDLIDKEILQEQFGIRDDRFEYSWNPRISSVNTSQKGLEEITDHLREKYKSDAELFFDIYGSKARIIILDKELKNKGINLKYESLNTIMHEGKVVGNMMNIKDDRFETYWKKRLDCNQFDEKTIKKAIDYLANERDLPNMKDKIDKETKDYLRFRKGICRELSLQGILYFVKLFDKENYAKVKGFIDKSIEKDRNLSKSISKIHRLREINDARIYEEFSFGVGKLLYSFDEKIRYKAQEKLVELYTPIIKNYRNPELRETAFSLLHDLALKHDVYINYHKGKNEITEFRRYLYSSLQYARYLINQKKKSSISLDTGGPEDGELYGYLRQGDNLKERVLEEDEFIEEERQDVAD